MSENTEDIQSVIGREFNLSLFLEEFVFAKTRFAPPDSSEIEFADAVIMLGTP